MSAEFFIGTKVFIYHPDTTDRRKHKAAEKIVRDALATGNACINSQVVQECLNVALRKAEVALSPEAARSYLDAVLAPLMQVTASEALYHRALDVQARWRFSFYDSLIVAGAMVAGCRTLLSEDLQHGQSLDSLTVVRPIQLARGRVLCIALSRKPQLIDPTRFRIVSDGPLAPVMLEALTGAQSSGLVIWVPI